MTKEEFQNWKESALTQEILQHIRELIEEGKEELADVAGSDPIRDRYVVGKIRGLREILEISIEDPVPQGEHD